MLPRFIFIFVLTTAVLGQQCSESSIELRQSDGAYQMYIMTRLETFDPSDGGETCGGPSNSKNAKLKFEQLNQVSQQHYNSFSFSDIATSQMKMKIVEFHPECTKGRTDLTTGLCTEFGLCSRDWESCSERMIHKYADEIIDRGLLHVDTGNSDMDKKLAIATVLLNVGFLQDAIRYFTEIIQKMPKLLVAYHGRALAYVRLGPHLDNNAQLALQDYATAISIDKSNAEIYEKRAELLLPLGRITEAVQDVDRALLIMKSPGLYGIRGLARFLQGNFVKSEEDLRRCLEKTETPQPNIMYHLGLSLLHHGKIQNAIEVFRDVLNIAPNNVDALFSLSQSYKELGNLKKARENFNKSLSLDPGNIVGRQLRANMFYSAGLPSLALQDAKVCLSSESSSLPCNYMQGVSYIALGQFYPGIKSLTKMLIGGSELPILRSTPEFIKAQYLKEYSRYLHAHLESPVEELNMGSDLDGEFKDSWAKGEPFKFSSNYKEQPGLQPSINDVTTPLELSDEQKTLVCKAEQLGALTQVTVDGIVPNQRLNLAMGLAAIHLGQGLESILSTNSNTKIKGGQTWKHNSWRDLFSIPIQYRRLVDPEQAIFWLDLMPKQSVTDGFKADISFIKGQASNVKLGLYFDLIFKLLKTMLEHYTGKGIASYEGMKEDIEKAKECQDLIKIARKRRINQQGFMVTTQVPSIIENKNRLDGTTIVLTQPETDQLNLVLSTASTRARTKSYHKELDFLFGKLQVLLEDAKKTGVKYSEFESFQTVVLNILYVFLNLMPLSRGTSSVAYTTVMGLFLAMGKEIQGKIPQGKLLDMEAMLSGAADAFTMVTKQWMTFKKATFLPSSLPKITKVFPTVRSVLEVLNIEQLDCPKGTQ